jgi:hypothetical protein
LGLGQRTAQRTELKVIRMKLIGSLHVRIHKRSKALTFNGAHLIAVVLRLHRVAGTSDGSAVREGPSVMTEQTTESTPQALAARSICNSAVRLSTSR